MAALDFTARELDIVSVLWSRGASTVTEVREHLESQDVDLAYNTVLTMLRILEEKGYVGHTEEGRAFRFHALVEQKEAGSSALARTINRLFGGSAEALVAQLVEERNLSQAELRRLRHIVDRQLRPAKSDDRSDPSSRRRK
jgi:predicted transcriptional regulator